MMFTVEKIGKSILKQINVIEFQKDLQRLNSVSNINKMSFYNFFHSSMHDRNQFESFIITSIVFFKGFPLYENPIVNMVKTYCVPLALKINFILWVLNNHNSNGKILKLINLPYNNIFEKFNQNCHLDNNELKKVFEKFFTKNDELFDLIIKLRNDFQNSRIFNKYIELLNIDESESEYYKKAIKSHFYIIKEIIFEVVLLDGIAVYDENNIIKYFCTNSAKGSSFDIKIIHANINDRKIVKINYNNHQKYALITSSIIKNSQKKGTVIRIKGEFIDKGFGKYSKNMDFCSERIDMLKEFNLPFEYLNIKY